MRLTCVNRTFGFGEFGNFYFKDTDGSDYYWGTTSDKAYELIQEGTEIEITSFKFDGTFEADGTEYTCLKNVRFKEV
jgi:hypothetical protein